MKSHRATPSYSMMPATSLGLCAVLLGFAGNFLYHYGFADQHISLLLGSSMALACLLQLAAAELVARSRRLTPFSALPGMGAALLLGCLAMLLDAAAAVAVAGLALANTMLQALPGMVNAMGMEAVERGSGTSFSAARGVGSIGYGLMALVTGLAVRQLGLSSIAILGALLTLLLLASAVWFRHCTESGRAPAASVQQKPRGSFLRQHPRFALFLLSAVLLGVGHNLGCNFMFQIIAAKGGGATEQGTATFIAAIVELPVMFGFPLLLKRMRCARWLCLSTLFYVIKLLGMFFAVHYTGIYAAQAAQLLGYAVFAIASVHYAQWAVGAGEAVRAQSYLASSNAVANLLAMSTGGVLCAALGVQTMLLLAAVIAALGAAGIFVTVRWEERCHG